ncbi:MAG: hypothetical protein Q8O67_28270 [Deltaproteobacteria bacterium]|nr:hypothetical protein [Deltaproteobacteria bacterium]
MAKKKKQQPSETSSSSSSAAVPSASAVAPADAQVAQLESAYALGNFSRVRELAAAATSPEAKSAVDRIMVRVVVEKEQAIVGIIGLLVVLVACALTLR